MAKTISYKELCERKNRAELLKANSRDQIFALHEEEERINDSIEAAIVSGDKAAYKNGVDRLSKIRIEIDSLESFCKKNEGRGGGSFYTDADVEQAWNAERENLRAAGLKSISSIEKILDKLMEEMTRFGQIKLDADKRRTQYCELMADNSRLSHLGEDIRYKNVINLIAMAKSESERNALFAANHPGL